jgi:ectoine hydroxylase-related dioxygenase (phytanoyl-CoA dioxygenase family)
LIDEADYLADLRHRGFCVVRSRIPTAAIDACRRVLWPGLLQRLADHADQPNRGPHRHFFPVPFTRPCFSPEFFFNDDVLRIVRGTLGDRVVADQWGCDTPVRGSTYQEIHADYQRPLFEESPELELPPYLLVVSFGVNPITAEDGPIEIAPGTHRMPRPEAARGVAAGAVSLEPVPLAIGDVLIRHPWALHRGTPNTTDTPRALLTIRYVRRWYADASRDVESIPRDVWESLTSDQQSMMRFPVASGA